MTYTVGTIVGSIASTSINRKLATALAKLAPQAGLELRDVAIAELPHYSADYDADYPESGKALKAAIESVDAVLIVTPEYNRSIPGVLKNAIDWASRPWGTNSFSGKPSAVIGASIGAIGTAVAQQHLRSILSFAASPELAQPEAYIHFTEGLVDDEGNVTNAATEQFLLDWLKAFAAHIEKNAA